MSEMPPTVTIAMPAYNEEDYIESCIASVQAQDYPRELIEILVADGRSTDKTRDILARLGTTIRGSRSSTTPSACRPPGSARW